MASHAMLLDAAGQRVNALAVQEPMALADGNASGGSVGSGIVSLKGPGPALISRRGSPGSEPWPAPASFGRRGQLEVRLACTQREIEAAQALRYRVFYEEMSAIPDAQMRLTQRDADHFDEICDHLLVFDHALTDGLSEGVEPPLDAVVGCYRLLRQEVADRHGGFYSATEYDILPFIAASPNKRFLELGRSCVLPAYRNRPTIELLWHGILHYVTVHRLDVMLGCASFEGTDPDKLAVPLSYLYHAHRAPKEWHVRALEHRYIEMNRMSRVEVSAHNAVRELPPLIKGYLRAGCYIGDGAVMDEQFGTTDVLILFPVSHISERYISKWERSSSHAM